MTDRSNRSPDAQQEQTGHSFAADGGPGTRGSGQRAGQPGGQPAGRPSGTSTASTSPTAILSEDAGKQFLKYIIGVFAVVGIGTGFGLFLFDAVAEDSLGNSFILIIGLFLPIFAAPIISMVTGVMTGLRLQTDEQSAAVVSAVGSLIGFVALVIIVIVFASIVLSDGGSSSGSSSGSNPDETLGPLLLFGVGVALTGAGSSFLMKRIQI